MPLVFASLAPHPPLLIPAIGKESINEVSKTQAAMQKMEEDLYLSKPDVLIIISPHGSYFEDAFTINICDKYVTDLKEFGDLTTLLEFKGEMDLSSFLRESSKDQDYPVTVISEKHLDHGSSVPLYYLTKHIQNSSLLPIGFCNLDWKTHVNFGYMLKNIVAESNKRVAIIASGDLSHALKTEAPAGFNADGEKFDGKIRELLEQNNLAGMLQLDPQLVENASECGFKSILMLLGVLKNVRYKYKEYSYEAPFGVGYLTANFVI